MNLFCAAFLLKTNFMQNKSNNEQSSNLDVFYQKLREKQLNEQLIRDINTTLLSVDLDFEDLTFIRFEVQEEVLDENDIIEVYKEYNFYFQNTENNFVKITLDEFGDYIEDAEQEYPFEVDQYFEENDIDFEEGLDDIELDNEVVTNDEGLKKEVQFYTVDMYENKNKYIFKYSEVEAKYVFEELKTGFEAFLEEKMKNNIGLVKRVAEIILDEEDMEMWCQDVMKGGCSSGIVSELIYYTDTYKWYDKYYHEIEDMRSQHEKSIGVSMLKPDDDIKNKMAWFSFEETLQNLYNEAAGNNLVSEY